MRKTVLSLTSGAQVDLSRPRRGAVTIEDIATSLGNLCRFVGPVLARNVLLREFNEVSKK